MPLTKSQRHHLQNLWKNSRAREKESPSDKVSKAEPTECVVQLRLQKDQLEKEVETLKSRLANMEKKNVRRSPSSIATSPFDGSSLYIPTPDKEFKKVSPVSPPTRLVVVGVNEIVSFVEALQETRACITPGCYGVQVPIKIQLKGMGGTVNIAFACNGCGLRGTLFEGSDLNQSLRNSDIGESILVAFIVSGCLFSTYYKVMKLALGIDVYKYKSYNLMLSKLHPIVKQMVDELCEEAKQELMHKDDNTLGSWKKAVTCADGAWHTRGFHSKNGTFSIRNYSNGALLYYKHLCQKGSDNVIEEELYDGTSKSMEGFAIGELMKQAKDDRMEIAVHWQDSDSSSAKVVTEHFPSCQIMICGGHAGRNHLKTLQEYLKLKVASPAFMQRHKDQFPAISEARCHCSRHRQGCGCLTTAFIQKARNNFSFILTQAQSAEEFAKRLRGLSRHARDEHEWVNEKGENEQCEFHSLKVCTCRNCEKDNVQCEGKPYSTTLKLTCEFHALMYEIECHNRASMADSLVHPVFGRGHSNWLEASHSVFIRYRSKDVALQRLHYEVSTNLGLLQSNMTYMWEKRGKEYHWIPELYKRLQLPLYDGMEDAYTRVNERRKRKLDDVKRDDAKRRRIELRKSRIKEASKRKTKHGKHNYDESGLGDTCTSATERSGKQCKCGSFNHSRTSSKECPLKKLNATTTVDHDKSDDIHVNDDFNDSSGRGYEHDLSDDEELNEDELLGSSSEDEIYMDSFQESCICGTLAKTHKRACPMNPRNRRYAPGNEKTTQPKTQALPARLLFDKVETADDSMNEEESVPVSGGKDEVESTDGSVDSFIPDGKQYCICKGEESKDMIQCDGPNCAIDWFHFKCVGLKRAPPTTKKWYCSTCTCFEKKLKRKQSQKQLKAKKPKIVKTKITQKESVTVSGPLPTEEWKSTALEYISTWSKMEITKQSQQIIKVTCPSIAPHVRDSVQGDGNCLFRAVSKGISGTEDNHLALRTAMVNFMTHKDSAFSCARYICSNDESLSEPIDTMKAYIKKNDLDKNGWGTDCDIQIIASMLQICIYVNGQYGKERIWARYKPLFKNCNCMAENDFKIYIFHDTNHYDHVVPKFD